MLRTLSCLLLLTALSCSAELEVKGNTRRVIGEKVTIELIDGDPALSGQVELRDAQSIVYGNEELNAAREDERTLSFTIPPGTAAGTATASLGKEGEDGLYSFSLSISRLAAGVQADGTIEVIPLGSSPLRAQTIAPPADPGTARELAISPLGGLLVSVIGDTLSFHRLGREVQVANAITGKSGMLAALPSGAVLASANGLQVLSYADGDGIRERGSLSLFSGEEARAVATSADGKWAVLLTSCTEAQPGDCLIRVDLRGTTPTRDIDIRLDDAVSAAHLALRADGSGALVADEGLIYGVVFGEESPFSLAWSAAQPAAIARTSLNISGHATDLFVVAAKGIDAVRYLGFQDKDLRDIQNGILELGFPPEDVAFGFGAEIYILSGQSIYKAAAQVDPSAAAVSTGALVRFAVQP